MSIRYQIKLRGKTLGDASLDELREQVRLGTVTRFHKLSSDGEHWRLAAEFPELFGDAAKSPPERPIQEPAPAPPAATEIEWHLTINEEPHGPFTNAQVLKFIREGRVAADDSAWREGFEDWELVQRVFPVAIGKRQRQLAREQKQREKQQKRAARLAARPKPEERSYSLLALASLVIPFLWLPVLFLDIPRNVILVAGGISTISGMIVAVLGLYEVASSKGYKKGLLAALLGMFIGLGGNMLVAVILQMMGSSLELEKLLESRLEKTHDATITTNRHTSADAAGSAPPARSGQRLSLGSRYAGPGTSSLPQHAGTGHGLLPKALRRILPMADQGSCGEVGEVAAERRLV